VSGSVLLDLDLGDGTTVDRNIAAIRAAGPSALVHAASDRPPAVRVAIRAGSLRLRAEVRWPRTTPRIGRL
jgi:hypothetical protein